MQSLGYGHNAGGGITCHHSICWVYGLIIHLFIGWFLIIQCQSSRSTPPLLASLMTQAVHSQAHASKQKHTRQHTSQHKILMATGAPSQTSTIPYTAQKPERSCVAPEHADHASCNYGKKGGKRHTETFVKRTKNKTGNLQKPPCHTLGTLHTFLNLLNLLQF